MGGCLFAEVARPDHEELLTFALALLRLGLRSHALVNCTTTLNKNK